MAEFTPRDSLEVIAHNTRVDRFTDGSATFDDWKHILELHGFTFTHPQIAHALKSNFGKYAGLWQAEVHPFFRESISLGLKVTQAEFHSYDLVIEHTTPNLHITFTQSYTQGVFYEGGSIDITGLPIPGFCTFDGFGKVVTSNGINPPERLNIKSIRQFLLTSSVYRSSQPNRILMALINAH